MVLLVDGVTDGESRAGIAEAENTKILVDKGLPQFLLSLLPSASWLITKGGFITSDSTNLEISETPEQN